MGSASSARGPAHERPGADAIAPRRIPSAHRADSPARRPRLRTIAVTSGKGGVGKTNIVTNLAIRLAELGQRVLLLDGDLSLANVDLLLGLVPEATLYDVVAGRCSVEEILLAGPAGIQILPASSGVEEMANLDDYRREVLLRSLEAVARDRDVLLVDTGSGIHAQSMRLAQVADEILVVTTPEPPAFADAYATLKVLSARRFVCPPRLVVNMAASSAEANRVAGRVRRVARRFLGLELEVCGMIPRDESVWRAVQEQQPFLTAHPTSPAAEAIRRLAACLLGWPGEPGRQTEPARHTGQAA